MEKFSVKKPFTVLVGVIMVLLLGFVALSHMQTNLLPDISTPYLMVVTVYPGASPERVESEVADVMENALGTVAGVDTITSTSAENYNLLLLKFSEGTDMNSTMVKVSNKVDQTVASLPDTCLTPSILEYSLNMNAFMTVAVSREGSDVYDLSNFVSDTLVPYVERKGGVSSVSANGLIEKMVQVQLNQKKIDVINEKLLETIDTQLAAAHEKLEEAQAQINAGRAEYEKQMKNYGDTVSDTVMAQMGTEVGSAVESVKNQAQDLLNSINELIEIVNDPDIKQSLVDIRDGLQNVVDQFNETGMRDIDALISMIGQLRDITDRLTVALQQLQSRLDTGTGETASGVDSAEVQKSLGSIYKTLEDTIQAMDNVPELLNSFSQALGSYSSQQLAAYMKFTDARDMLNNYQAQYEAAEAQYEAAKEKALASADVAKQLDIDTLATLIYAQNFSMPAGYVKDSSGQSWLLKVGEEYDSIADIEGALLLHVDGFGDVRLSDVADVEVIDNAEASYTRLNGERAAVLKIFKSGTASASDVSSNCLAAFKELQAQYEGLHVVVLSNQGNYITIIVKSILTSMIVGAALAIIVLAIFLKDVKPTLVVGISIPLSVLFAVVLMYFTGLDMNIMTLAGLSLGIGMLVDNSVVVIENIYRLRGRGVAATARGGAGRKAGEHVHRGLYPHLGLRLPARRLHLRDRPQPDAAHVPVHRLLPDGLPHRGHLGRPGGVRYGAEKGRAQEAGLVREGAGQIRPQPAVVLPAPGHPAGAGHRAAGLLRLAGLLHGRGPAAHHHQQRGHRHPFTTDTIWIRQVPTNVAGQVVEALQSVDDVEEVGITTDTSVAGIDIANLGLPATITDLLNAANSYGSYQINVKLEREPLLHQDRASPRGAGKRRERRGALHRHRGDQRDAGADQHDGQRPVRQGLWRRLRPPSPSFPKKSSRWSTTPRALPTPPPASARAMPPLT